MRSAADPVTFGSHRTCQSGRALRDLIDVDAFIDHHILNALAKNPDAFHSVDAMAAELDEAAARNFARLPAAHEA